MSGRPALPPGRPALHGSQTTPAFVQRRTNLQGKATKEKGDMRAGRGADRLHSGRPAQPGRQNRCATPTSARVEELHA